VLPSYYREGVPRSLLEAAAMGKPIITTNNVGCKEVVDEGINGFKCNIKDSVCIVKAMQNLIEMPKEERIQMGRNGRLKMEKEFDEKFVLDSYMKAIKEISLKKNKER
jgi:glycosyltransferase involved in cell wall biosynthesis